YAAPMPRAALMFDVELLAIQGPAAGAPGTVRVRTNSPDAVYDLILPDGTPQQGKGPQDFAAAAPGRYRVKPAPVRSYATGIASSDRDMALAPGGTLEITINYVPVVR